MAELNCNALPTGAWRHQLLAGKLPNETCRLTYSKETLPLGKLVPFLKAKDDALLPLIESTLGVRVLLVDADNPNRIRRSVLKDWKLQGPEELETIDYFVRTRRFDILPREILPFEYVPAHFYGSNDKADSRPFPGKAFFLLGAEATRRQLIKLVLFALNYQSNNHDVLSDWDGIKVERRSEAGIMLRELQLHLELNLKKLNYPEPHTTNTKLSIRERELDELERDLNKRFDLNSFALENPKLLRLDKADRQSSALETLNSISMLEREFRPYEKEGLPEILPGIEEEKRALVEARLKSIRRKINEMRAIFRTEEPRSTALK